MALITSGIKDYQAKLLDAFASFLSRSRELKSPAAAFKESTSEHFGYALPYHPLPGAELVPYVCLRVPTGGGKTRIAGQAIKRVNDSFLATENSLVLWLVPSDPIREQTLYALKTKGELLHQDMQDLFGSVHVLDINDALHVQPSTLNTGNTIIVATMQSFKRDSAEGLRVFRQNGALLAHFEGLAVDERGDCSLLDVIRSRHPFIIVDEAHNQGTTLAVDTLVKLGPSCILELTATPDRANQPSNVLRSVSAATLQAEDMLKLPLELAIHPEWRISMAESISRLRQLELDAKDEELATGEIINPVVMLIQAERKIQDKETFTPERVKKHLINDFQIPEDRIAIATGAVDELAGKVIGQPGYPQFIITVDKLREGWDCPLAYVLFSFRNTTSATAVEQVLGRILRMPHVVRKQKESLNRSYAYVVSGELVTTVQGLRDGLVQSGFERLETKDLIQAESLGDAGQDMLSSIADLTIALPVFDDTVVLPDTEAIAALPNSLREKIEFVAEAGTFTVKGGANPNQLKQISEVFKQPEISKAVKEHLDSQAAIVAASLMREKTPAEKGGIGVIPLLGITQHSFFDVFDETFLLDADWELEDFDSKLTEAEFAHDVEAMRRASLNISQLEKIECDVYEKLDSQLALFNREHGWKVSDLIFWLDKNLYFPYADSHQKSAWILSAISYLMDERSFGLEELAYRKFRLRGALERKLVGGLTLAKQRVFDSFFSDDMKFDVRDECAVVFEQGRYGYDVPYTGLIPLKKHFFPIIGNLKNSGEEFECAEFIANQLDGVEWWIRNVERKVGSFWLQTASDKFYPDFLIKMKSGAIIAVEYKGRHISESRDSREKKLIGELWEKRSNGRCGFAWVENKNQQPILDAIKRTQ